ncbi:DUF1778 domain-containing protein [Thalassospira sp.]|uniref:type II toxin-antitoxin system TacA family antitoxin n=1 Tax=Thalassospira sp. TaxID=1912094 RepID=UPI0027362620|nr:DUF1778 domain-containing protein [Thalassospira sp.]MDP2697577.1 DUF1778 domain-containing protein [Thalassospira sp.]
MNTAAPEEQLTGRFSIRVTPDDERLIRKGANSAQARNISDYLIQSALIQAKIALADRTVFTLHPDAVAAFYDALDHPAEPAPALRKLFAKKTIFEA